MKRRRFVTLLGSGLAWPLVAGAQQKAMPVIGLLNSRTPGDTGHLMAGFRKGLAESGYIEDQNVTIEYRWASGQYERLPALVKELVRHPVAVLVATGGEPVALAAMAATSTIPIVFVISGDPAKLGLADSFSRPGKNATGVSNFLGEIGPKRLALLHELVPQAATIGFLSNPAFPTAETQLNDVEEAARTVGFAIEVYRASTAAEIDAAFKTISQRGPAALLVAADPFFDIRRSQIVILAARHAVPAMYQLREYPAAGGLISYGIDLPDVYRQMGNYAGKILNGAKPADLPVVRPTRFELVLNLQTAKTLGLTVPPSILASADEVIE